MNWYRISIPGLGFVWAQASDPASAIQRAVSLAGARGVNLGQTDISGLSATPVSSPEGGSGIAIDSKGKVTQVGQQGGGGTGGPTGEQADVPTQVAQPTGGVGGGGGASLAPDPEEVSAFGQYRNYLRSIGLDPDSIIGGTAAQPGRFQDILGVHGLNQVLHNLTGTFAEGGGSQASQITGQGGPQSFLDFVRTQGNQGIAATALGALQGVAGQGPGGDNSFLGVLQQARPGTDIGNILEGTALQALRTQLSPAALGLFGNQALGLAGRRFEDSLAGAASGGTTAPTYSQALLRSLGLA